MACSKRPNFAVNCAPGGLMACFAEEDFVGTSQRNTGPDSVDYVVEKDGAVAPVPNLHGCRNLGC